MKAMIFAAGLGTRLRPITDTIPKALVPIAGKPLLEHVVTKLADNGFDEIVVNVHHHADKIISFLNEKKNFGIHIDISDEKDLLMDTGGAIAQAMPLLAHSDVIMVHNVDIMSSIRLSDIANRFVQSGDDAWLVTQNRDTSRKLLFDTDGRLVGWRNITNNAFKWVDGESSHYEESAFNGIHFFKPSLFSGTEQKPASVIDLYLALAKDNTIRQIKVSPAFWFDLGKPQEIEHAEKTMKQTGI